MRPYMQLPALALVLALAACAQTTRWERPQTGEEATAADFDECRVQAREETWRIVGFYPLGYPYYGLSPYFYGPSPYRGWRYEHEARFRQDQWLTESRLASFCMRNKGYERVVVETPKS